MRTCWSISLLIFSLLFHNLSLGNSDAASGTVSKVPPFDISQKDLCQYLNLGDNIKFDVPALYVFGDSIVDSGNNNFLPSLSVSNYSPFGVDFADGKATGRFTNGRTKADFIAQILGLPFPPPCLGLSNEQQMTLQTGVNYASSSAGILPDTGKSFMQNTLGKEVTSNASSGKTFSINEPCLCFDIQIDLFEKTVENLKSQFNNAESFANYLSKSLFLINIGNGDLSLGLAGLESKSNGTLSIEETLAQEFKIRLQRLYELGARKFLVSNIFALGCTPFNLNTIKPNTTCVNEGNDHAKSFNKHLSTLIPQLQSNLRGSKFVIEDMFTVMMDAITSPSLYGITNTKSSCCIDLAGNGTRPCAPNVTPCNDRNEHVFFDPFHPSEKLHFLLASRCFKESSICQPSVVELLQA